MILVTQIIFQNTFSVGMPNEAEDHDFPIQNYVNLLVK